METLMNHIKFFVERAEQAGNIEKAKETVRFVNIKDENDFFLNFEDAFEKGLNLSDYKKEVLKENPKEELTKLLTDQPYLLKEDILLLEKTVKYAKKMVHRNNKEDEELSGKESPSEDKKSKAKKKVKK
jgi:hypothetical protein